MEPERGKAIPCEEAKVAVSAAVATTHSKPVEPAKAADQLKCATPECERTVCTTETDEETLNQTPSVADWSPIGNDTSCAVADPDCTQDITVSVLEPSEPAPKRMRVVKVSAPATGSENECKTQ